MSSFPLGVTTIAVSSSGYLDMFGEESTLRVKVRPLFGGANHLLWTGTGDVVNAAPRTFAAKGVPVTFDLPVTDQDGWLDPTGEAYEGWAYEARATVYGSDGVERATWRKVFQPIAADGLTFDLDVVPEAVPGVEALVVNVPGPQGPIGNRGPRGFPGVGAVEPDAAYVRTLSPTAYGAEGDDTADDRLALQDTVDAAAEFGDVAVDLRGLTYLVTDEVEIPAGTVLRNGRIRSSVAGKTPLVLLPDAHDVTLEDLDLVGPNAVATAVLAEHAILAEGASAAAPIRNLTIRRVKADKFGYIAFRLKHVAHYTITECELTDIGYAGFGGTSVLYGSVTHNYVANVLAGFSANGYGMFLSRFESDSLVSDPHSAYNDLSHNVIIGSPWEGMDEHGGICNSFTHNIILGCGMGVASGPSDNAANLATWAPKGTIIDENQIDSLVDDGSASYGVSIAGAEGVLGASVDHATGAARNNIIRRHGKQSAIGNGAMRLRDTLGYLLTGNHLFQPSPHGILLENDNYGIVDSGNVVIDNWSNAVASASGHNLPSGYVTGLIGGNLHRDHGTKPAATYKNTNGYRQGTATGVLVEVVGNNFSAATTPVNGATVATTKHTERFAQTFTADVALQGKVGFGAAAAPVTVPMGAILDATDAASAITRINTLLSRLRTIGLIAP